MIDVIADCTLGAVCVIQSLDQNVCVVSTHVACHTVAWSQDAELKNSPWTYRSTVHQCTVDRYLIAALKSFTKSSGLFCRIDVTLGAKPTKLVWLDIVCRPKAPTSISSLSKLDTHSILQFGCGACHHGALPLSECLSLSTTVPSQVDGK